jgi:hypothetical protein
VEPGSLSGVGHDEDHHDAVALRRDAPPPGGQIEVKRWNRTLETVATAISYPVTRLRLELFRLREPKSLGTARY